LEVAEILVVRGGIAPFDVVESQLDESPGDQKLVLNREADPLGLGTVAKGGVVHLDTPLGEIRLHNHTLWGLEVSYQGLEDQHANSPACTRGEWAVGRSKCSFNPSTSSLRRSAS